MTRAAKKRINTSISTATPTSSVSPPKFRTKAPRLSRQVEIKGKGIANAVKGKARAKLVELDGQDKQQATLKAEHQAELEDIEKKISQVKKETEEAIDAVGDDAKMEDM